MGVRESLLIFVFCCALKYGTTQLVSGNILNVLQRTTGFSKFAQLVIRAKMGDQFQSPAKFTVFAFNDTAYNALPYKKRIVIDSYNEADLQDYIRFCTIYAHTLMTSSMQDNQVMRSMASSGNRLFFNRRQRTDFNPSGNFGPTSFYVNGVEIADGVSKDMQATNGVIHGMKGVMMMTSTKAAYGYVREPDDTSIRTNKFIQLMNYQTTYFDEINDLSSPDKLVTMFVPNDNAMSKIPPVKLQQLQSNPRELQRILKAHYIPNRVVYSSYINHNEAAPNALGQPVSFRKPYGYSVYVNSEGVSAAIVEGNITVSNGVVHVIDSLLGYVYNNVREQIQVEGAQFEQLVNYGTEAIKNSLVQQSGVNVFVPLDTAFQKIRSMKWVNLGTNQTLADMTLRLHILQSNQQILISTLPGTSGYESRQYRTSMYRNEKITIYNERNESWVQGGNVKARVIRPDIKTVNGMVHVIDTILGIPYLDLAMLICSDTWLLRTYDYMRRVGMKNYLTDRRFTADKCSFELYGYPPNYGTGVTSNTGTTCPTYCAQAQYANQYPCNVAPCNVVGNTPSSSSTCPSYCSQPNYANQYPCNNAQVCPTGSSSNCPSYCSQAAYANQYPCNNAQICSNTGQTSCPSYCQQPNYANQYPCNTAICNLNNNNNNNLNTGSQTTATDMGYCGTQLIACSHTVFIVNSSALDYFLLSANGQQVSKDAPRLQYLFKRLIFKGEIVIEKLANGNHQFTAINGDNIRLTKTNDRDVRVYFASQSANLIHMDEGATNGIMHIVDRLLFVQEDLTRDVSGSAYVTLNLWLFIATLSVFLFLRIFNR